MANLMLGQKNWVKSRSVTIDVFIVAVFTRNTSMGCCGGDKHDC